MPLEAARSKKRLKTNKCRMPDFKLQTEQFQTEQLQTEKLQTEHLKTSAEAQSRLADMAMSAAVRCLCENYSPLEITLDKARDCLRLVAASDLEGPADRLGVIQQTPESGKASSDALRAEYYHLIRVLRGRLAAKLLDSDTQVWRRAWTRAIGTVDYALFRVTESSVYLRRLMPARQFQRYE